MGWVRGMGGVGRRGRWGEWEVGRVGGRCERWVGGYASCEGVVCKLEEVGRLLCAFISRIFDTTLVKSSL